MVPRSGPSLKCKEQDQHIPLHESEVCVYSKVAAFLQSFALDGNLNLS